jgi:hypothetical protein
MFTAFVSVLSAAIASGIIRYIENAALIEAIIGFCAAAIGISPIFAFASLILGEVLRNGLIRRSMTLPASEACFDEVRVRAGLWHQSAPHSEPIDRSAWRVIPDRPKA